MAGINRALIRGYGRIIYENKVVQNNSKVCVFISHKSSDMDAAEAVARYLMLFEEFGDGIKVTLFRKVGSSAKKVSSADKKVSNGAQKMSIDD